MTIPDGFLDDPRFSRTFEFQLPDHLANGRTAPFKVGYADFGYHDEEHPGQERVFLYFAPLLSSRLVHVAKDELAKKHKVRIINPDRPGMGMTDGAEADKRLEVWRGKNQKK